MFVHNYPLETSCDLQPLFVVGCRFLDSSKMAAFSFSNKKPRIEHVDDEWGEELTEDQLEAFEQIASQLETNNTPERTAKGSGIVGLSTVSNRTISTPKVATTSAASTRTIGSNGNPYSITNSRDQSQSNYTKRSLVKDSGSGSREPNVLRHSVPKGRASVPLIHPSQVPQVSATVPNNLPFNKLLQEELEKCKEEVLNLAQENVAKDGEVKLLREKIAKNEGDRNVERQLRITLIDQQEATHRQEMLDLQKQLERAKTELTFKVSA